MIVAALCAGAAALVAFLAFQCLLGAKAQGSRPAPERREGPDFIVLMPAHDEARGIAAAVASVMTQLRDSDRLLVVADNCNDDTAHIALASGADVVERCDPSRRGKGHALEFGRTFLRGKPGDVVIIVDADCEAEPGALARLAATAARRDAVVQGAYLLAPPGEASARVRISCFAFMIKNRVRQRALQRLTGSALLQGSGMAFPRRIFDRVEWRAASLVEDLDMGLDLLLSGERVIFEDDALFVSAASSDKGMAGQRRRWEHGMLNSMGRYVPALLSRALRGRWRLAVVALDLMIPPTVLLLASALLLLAAGARMSGANIPVLFLTLALALLGVGLARAWRAEGRDILPLRSVARIPAYMLWKLRIAAQFLTRRERHWIRTEREP
ncbi:MAG: glycosyltransferase [Sphingopyxis sp.]|nr:glycosyltransferase [Sphingopyxis sp.]